MPVTKLGSNRYFSLMFYSCYGLNHVLAKFCGNEVQQRALIIHILNSKGSRFILLISRFHFQRLILQKTKWDEIF